MLLPSIAPVHRLNISLLWLPRRWICRPQSHKNSWMFITAFMSAVSTLKLTFFKYWCQEVASPDPLWRTDVMESAFEDLHHLFFFTASPSVVLMLRPCVCHLSEWKISSLGNQRESTAKGRLIRIESGPMWGKTQQQRKAVNGRGEDYSSIFSSASLNPLDFLWLGRCVFFRDRGVTCRCSLIHVCNEGLCLHNPIRWPD